MAYKNYDESFSSVLPHLRMREDIVSFLETTVSGGATNVAQNVVAEIELHIKDGDKFYRCNQYNSALKEFKQARASIYKVLHPDFDFYFNLGRKDIALPVSTDIEKDLLKASVRLVDMIRPSVVEPRLVLRDDYAPLPENLKPYTLTGFHESVSIEETLQVASVQGVALMKEDKAETAIDLMEDALVRATAPRLKVDPTLTAALELNLSAAHLQINNIQKATTLANTALKHFQVNKDLVGQAQAFHLAGVSQQMAGNAAKAKQLFKKAASILKKASTKTNFVPAVSPKVKQVKRVPPVKNIMPSNINPFGVGVAHVPIPVPQIPVSSYPSARTLQSKGFASCDFGVLLPILNMDPQKLTFRIPGRAYGWGILTLTDKQVKKQKSKDWTIGVPVGLQMVLFNVGSGKPPSTSHLVSSIYMIRPEAQFFMDIDWKIVDTSTTTFYLTHLYAFVLPVKIGDCFHEMGLYSKAEEYYLQASKYTYLNKKVEATSLWNRLARNALEWGDSLYKNNDLTNAKTEYSKIITTTNKVPKSFLYTSAALKVPATAAKTLINKLLERPLPEIN